MSGKPFILRVEGVDFASTIDDTQQLSAYRGGSLALLQMADDVEDFLIKMAEVLGIEIDSARDANNEPECRIFAGASRSALLFRAPDEAAAETVRGKVEEFLKGAKGNKKKAPHAFLSYVVDVAAGDDIAALTVAEARNRARQFARSWALPPFSDKVKHAQTSPDYDRIRPADTEFYPPKGRLLIDDDDNERRDGAPIDVSASFAARHAYGRTQRQGFYRAYARQTSAKLTKGKLFFTNHFEDIVADLPKAADPPKADEKAAVPGPIQNKLAVFYADGNRFGALYRNAASLNAYSKLSQRMRGHQSALLEAILEWFRAGAKSEWWRAFAVQDPEGFPDRDQLGLRFETLLWGGDELTFVMPAWLGLDFLDGFLEQTETWTAPDETRLTHGIGLVFCHYKTPIRQARKVAKALANDTKRLFGDKPDDYVQIEAFESIALPDPEDGVGRYRAQLYDVERSTATDRALCKAVTLSRDDWRQAYGRMKELRGLGGEAFPRSQIYRFLRLATELKAFALDAAAQDANAKVEAEIRRYFERVGPTGFSADELLQPPRPPAYSLALFASLWDYAALPCESDWPAFAEATALSTAAGSTT